jgi:hypothetical protein
VFDESIAQQDRIEQLLQELGNVPAAPADEPRHGATTENDDDEG